MKTTRQRVEEAIEKLAGKPLHELTPEYGHKGKAVIIKKAQTDVLYAVRALARAAWNSNYSDSGVGKLIAVAIKAANVGDAMSAIAAELR